MRTTVTLDPDVDALLRRAMRERGLSFKAALNEGLRKGLGAEPTRRPFRLPAYDLGEPLVPLEKALRLAAALEDEEIVRKLSLGK